jgi:hypothetical protein
MKLLFLWLTGFALLNGCGSNTPSMATFMTKEDAVGTSIKIPYGQLENQSPPDLSYTLITDSNGDQTLRPLSNSKIYRQDLPIYVDIEGTIGNLLKLKNFKFYTSIGQHLFSYGVGYRQDNFGLISWFSPFHKSNAHAGGVAIAEGFYPSEKLYLGIFQAFSKNMIVGEYSGTYNFGPDTVITYNEASIGAFTTYNNTHIDLSLEAKYGYDLTYHNHRLYLTIGFHGLIHPKY